MSMQCLNPSVDQIPSVPGDCGWANVAFRRAVLTHADAGVLTGFMHMICYQCTTSLPECNSLLLLLLLLMLLLLRLLLLLMMMMLLFLSSLFLLLLSLLLLSLLLLYSLVATWRIPFLQPDNAFVALLLSLNGLLGMFLAVDERQIMPPHAAFGQNPHLRGLMITLVPADITIMDLFVKNALPTGNSRVTGAQVKI